MNVDGSDEVSLRRGTGRVGQLLGEEGTRTARVVESQERARQAEGAPGSGRRR